jgi:predicted nuclease of predicted toxin-antitoxin system
MNVKLDENMPAALVEALAELGHHVDTLPGEELSGAQDDAVWATAQSAGRFLVTQDLDFSDIRRFEPGTHHGILLVRLHNPTRRRLTERVRLLFQTEDVTAWRRCFVVATDHKLRVRRPTGPEPTGT